MDIVYRVGGDGYDCALFAERSSAERVAQILTALRDSTTWGEFRAELPADEWEDVLQYCFEEDEVPADDAPFHRDMVPGYADGDYPEWLRGSAVECSRPASSRSTAGGWRRASSTATPWIFRQVRRTPLRRTFARWVIGSNGPTSTSADRTSRIGNSIRGLG